MAGRNEESLSSWMEISCITTQEIKMNEELTTSATIQIDDVLPPSIYSKSLKDLIDLLTSWELLCGWEGIISFQNLIIATIKEEKELNFEEIFGIIFWSLKYLHLLSFPHYSLQLSSILSSLQGFHLWQKYLP